MKLSTNARYAIRVLFELAEVTKPISIANLSEKTGITLRTVENISTVLRTHAITSSIVGAGGGILLQTQLKDISLGQIVTFFDEGIDFAVCCGNKANDCPNQSTCKTRAVWQGVSAKIQAELDAIALDTILHQYRVGHFEL